ncbi:MAG TPA: HEAT repeat domain-containing protein [Kofleriaceae bacterium]
MLRLIALVSASMLVTAACDSRKANQAPISSGSAGSAGSGSQASAPVPKPRPASVFEQVLQWAPAGAQVVPADLRVPGIELFLLTAADDQVAPAGLVGVAGGVGGEILEGRELVRAAIDGKADKKTLAQLALGVAGDDSELLDAPKTREQQQARVGPPQVAHGALVFWVWTADVPRMVERARLDLTTGALEIEPPKLSHEVVISNAITTLGSPNASRHAVAIRTLAASCAEPRPRQALLAALANHPRVKTRLAVADEAHKCGAAAVDALITAMAQDKAGQVRSQAASSLGRIGDDRARPALAKAARGEDANLAWAAKNALGKLK